MECCRLVVYMKHSFYVKLIAMEKNKQLLAITLILLAFSSGMILTAATSGCDGQTISDTPSHTSALHQPAQPTSYELKLNN